MSLNEIDRKALVSLYIEKAKLTMHEADIAINAETWGMAANRLYYALFHAITALFVNDGIAVGTHRGVKAKFGEHYVLTGKFPAEYAKVVAQLETLRDKADYNIMFVASKEDVVPHVDKAKNIIEDIESRL